MNGGRGLGLHVATVQALYEKDKSRLRVHARGVKNVHSVEVQGPLT